MKETTIVCMNCNGDGFTSEHAAYCQDGDGNCSGIECPVQVQCEKCKATGGVIVI